MGLDRFSLKFIKRHSFFLKLSTIVLIVCIAATDSRSDQGFVGLSKSADADADADDDVIMVRCNDDPVPLDDASFRNPAIVQSPNFPDNYPAAIW